ncbi:aminotransferase class I/II-fold pyridoxal phosphate-dependent enzyme [Burkholderia sp. Ac-20379]|uniref:aminotransferase class I/II-fold pyridoxal phosphate-dependent enzyme n=1 Tax=Burkholderia sp. Ac-20379 TaxID=2703900 RepID=UPI00197F2519|nr:aminotransferase class I/II-fold pyridoxal phosphate-dependent enzyme [Burkholderia sp. Ac-20379]MBN3727135.1 aminotransferase class I/II-fold pyridoxal phosphate-dependent enzyme [Burkholderia sp. Ac-20379]
MTSNQLAPRMSRVQPSPTAAISDKVRALTAAGKAVINLGEGELHFDTPEHIKRAGIAAIERGDTKYTAVAGTAELLDAIIEKFDAENGIRYTRAEVIAGTGAKQLIFNALLATIAPEDEVLICAPYWVSYPDMVALADGRVRVLPSSADDGWKLRPEVLRAAIGPRTRWLILNSPNNPTGAVYTHDELKALTDVLVDHEHVLLMADDIYEHTRYTEGFATPVQIEPRLRERTLTVNGVSKGYSMTGWRIGYAGGPAWLIRAMVTLQSQSTSNPSTISQAAAIAALRGGTGFMRDWLGALRESRDRVLATVARCEGLQCDVAEGAFYAFVNCAGLVGATTPDGKVLRNDFDFASYLLDTAHVGVVHGGAFGVEHHVRIAYAVPMATLDEACRRIEAACAALVLPTVEAGQH